MENRGGYYGLSKQIDSEKLRPVLLRCLNRNQILILKEISSARNEKITPVLLRLSRNSGIPISTLKLNAVILKKLELVSSDTSVSLTKAGLFVLEVIGGEA